jgi:hypothetical protein
VRYIKNIILSYIQKVKQEKYLPAEQHAMVIFDVFKGHRIEDVETVLKENNLVSVIVPSNCTVSSHWISVSTKP